MPPSLTNPSEIARETLRMLASRRMAPSPDNYRTIYAEISGDTATLPSAFPARELKALLAALPKESPEQMRFARQLDQAIRDENWDDTRRALLDLIASVSSRADLGWSELIGELLRLWEMRHAGMTPARKREALEHILSSAGANNETLFNRLQGLARAWAAAPPGGDDIPLVAGDIPGVAGGPAAANGAAAANSLELMPEFREMLAYALDSVISVQLGEMPEMATEARTLAASVRAVNSLKSLKAVRDGLKRLAFRLELLVGDQAELRGGLLHLLQLLIDNVSELVIDDRWLSGQVTAVREIIGRPLNVRTIDDAERRLKEVIYKQSQL